MTTGVLLMAHGTPSTTAGIEPFYTRIRRGRPPTAEQLAELESRYAAIGGVSPLAIRTDAQVDAIRAALEARSPGRYLVAFGAKHTDPLLEEAAAQLGAAGVERVIGLVLTPILPPWDRRSTSTVPRPRSGRLPSSPSHPGTGTRAWWRSWPPTSATRSRDSAGSG